MGAGPPRPSCATLVRRSGAGASGTVGLRSGPPAQPRGCGEGPGEGGRAARLASGPRGWPAEAWAHVPSRTEATHACPRGKRGLAGSASRRAFGALPPWIAVRERAGPRTQGALWGAAGGQPGPRGRHAPHPQDPGRRPEPGDRAPVRPSYPAAAGPRPPDSRHRRPWSGRRSRPQEKVCCWGTIA